MCALGTAADPEISHVFWPHLKKSFLEPGEYIGMRESADIFGRGGFLANHKAVSALLWAHDKRRFRKKGIPSPAERFLRMLRCLRGAMEALALAPITTETGESPADFMPRSFADAEHMVANEISQLGRFHARVRTLTGEYTIQTRPAPRGLTGPALEARIAAIKERMVDEGLLWPVQDIMKEVAERHERLRAPASRRSGSGRLLRTSEPTPLE